MENIELKECRICFEEDDVSNMISPCLCRGSSKYVHLSCLNEWRTLSENEENLKTCPSCKFKYVIEKKNCNGRKLLNNFLKTIGKNYITLLYSNIIITACLSIFIWFFSENFMVYSSGEKDDLLDLNHVNINVCQLSVFILQIFYLLFFIINFCFSKNKLLLFNYYKRKKIFIVFYLYIISILSLIYVDIIGIIVSLMILTSFVSIYVNELKSINAVQDEEIISLKDSDIRLNLN